MTIVTGEQSPQVKSISEKIFSKLKNKYPGARGFKLSLREDHRDTFMTTLEVRVGRKKLITKKIGTSAHESIDRAYSALKKRIEKSLPKRKSFFTVPAYNTIQSNS